MHFDVKIHERMDEERLERLLLHQSWYVSISFCLSN
jgi:hypothetical protein